jgi:transposase-like protein
MSINCKSCSSEKVVKNGFAHEQQRYRCQDCRYNFIEGDKRVKYSAVDRLKVIKLYLENCGIRTIERLTGIRNSQISQWLERAAEDIKLQLQKAQSLVTTVEDIELVEIDELCTYIKKDPKTEESLPSYGLLLIDNRVKLLILR